jgi:hypothetical protein
MSDWREVGGWVFVVGIAVVVALAVYSDWPATQRPLEALLVIVIVGLLLYWSAPPGSL